MCVTRTLSLLSPLLHKCMCVGVLCYVKCVHFDSCLQYHSSFLCQFILLPMSVNHTSFLCLLPYSVLQ